MFKHLKDYTLTCKCNGHFKVAAYSETEAKELSYRCMVCGCKPYKLIRVERNK